MRTSKVSHSLSETLRLIWIWVRVHQLNIWRTPMPAFFTVIFPLLMFLLLAGLIDGSIAVGGITVSLSQFYAPAIGCFAIASSTFTNLSIGIAFQRDDGTLKRIRATPTSPSTFVCGQIISSILMAAVAFLLMLLVGIAAFDVSFPAASQIPAAIVSFLLGSVTFAALGLAVGALAPTATSAPAIANIIILPLAFLSNVFIPTDQPPAWLRIVGDIGPMKPFVEQLGSTTNPHLASLPLWDGVNLGTMAAWLAVAAFICIRYFRWLPPVSKPK